MKKEEGLLDKYVVLKCEGDGPPDLEIAGVPLWRKNSWAFVLSPQKEGAYGVAARWALRAYANSIEEENPTLARDLREVVTKTEAAYSC